MKIVALLAVLSVLLAVQAVSIGHQSSIHAQQLNTFDSNLAKRYSEFVSAAYCAKKGLPNWSCGPCKSTGVKFALKAVFNGPEDTLAYVGKDVPNKQIVVVFRGSQSPQNWLTNLKMVKSNSFLSGFGKVHAGFQSAYNGVRSSLRRAVKALLKDSAGFDVVVTGHSLGGALATICAADLAVTDKLPKVSLYTFGSPRVGDSTFVSAFQKVMGTRYHRVVKDKDFVPKVPLKALGYAHAGREVWQRGASYKVCSTGDAADCSEGVPFKCPAAKAKAKWWEKLLNKAGCPAALGQEGFKDHMGYTAFPC